MSKAAVRLGRILIIDDEPMMAKVIQRALAQDYDTLATVAATEALEWIAAGQRFDLIVCDLMMPGMTGMQLHEHLSRTAPEQAERMIFLTGGAFTPQMQAFVKRSDKVCLEKPFEPAALRLLVSRRIGTHGAD